MKHQYFGDVNDYLKYGLLRRLTAPGRITVTACWMLTPDQPGNRDGGKLAYLRDNAWRVHDPELFDFLRSLDLGSIATRRHVSLIEDSNLLPNVRPFSSILPDSREGRAAFFAELLRAAAGTDLVFFDPDNGFAPRSVARGGKSSSKYLHWDEVEDVHAAGHSILAFQHFARRNRAEHIAELVTEARRRTGARRTWPLRTAHALFLLVPGPEHEPALAEAVANIQKAWAGRITLDTASLQS